mmetsp:Transcript_94804/g.225775  ORF Transcript_94804/g.225775 Transcript_94804/m.225775 type:complete len:286 (+) Transcript_94804:535-1392(+)
MIARSLGQASESPSILRMRLAVQIVQSGSRRRWTDRSALQLKAAVKVKTPTEPTMTTCSPNLLQLCVLELRSRQLRREDVLQHGQVALQQLRLQQPQRVKQTVKNVRGRNSKEKEDEKRTRKKPRPPHASLVGMHHGGWAWSFDLLAMRSSCRLMGSCRLARTAQRTLRNLSRKVKGSPKAKARRERKATILEKERASLKERMAKAKARTSRERMARANLRARERASLARTCLTPDWFWVPLDPGGLRVVTAEPSGVEHRLLDASPCFSFLNGAVLYKTVQMKPE